MGAATPGGVPSKAPDDGNGRMVSYAVLKMGRPRYVARLLDRYGERNRKSSGMAWFVGSPDRLPFLADDLEVLLYVSVTEIADGRAAARMVGDFGIPEAETSDAVARMAELRRGLAEACFE